MSEEILSKPYVTHAQNDRIFGADEQPRIDLFAANGATFLGHCHPAISAHVAAQIEKLWLTGGLPTPVYEEARAMVELWFPDTHALAGLYSTGMEAAEFALRIARVATQKNGAIGFEKSMHGKSLATAYLGWDNQDDLHLPHFARLPFVSQSSEADILQRLEAELAKNAIAAVFVEPIQGTGGGWEASPDFYRCVEHLCRQYRSLLVFDEILTGFYRTGNAFYFQALGFVPDLILLGKAIGNGFPVSGVVVSRNYAIVPSMLPGSTYAGNPLAAAAVVATLTEMQAIDLPNRVAQIETVVRDRLSDLSRQGIILRGKGAFWMLELPLHLSAKEIVIRLYQRGVFVSYTRNLIRLLPAATIAPENLRAACDILCEELSDATAKR